MPSHQASRLRSAATVLPLAASLVVGLFGCAEANRIVVSGNVDDNIVTVQAPQIETSQPGNWNRIAAVEVREGDQVRAGQILVSFDSEALAVSVSIARADAKVAASQIPVLDSAIDETYDKEDSVKSALKKINKAIRQLKGTRATLVGQLAQARGQLPQLEAKRAEVQSQRHTLEGRSRQIDKQLAALPKVSAQTPSQAPDSPTPSAAPASPNRDQLLAQIAQLRQAKTQLGAGLTQLRGAETQLTTALSRLRSGIPRLEQAIGQIDAGLAKARAERTKLRKARIKIIDARAELRRTRKLAVVAADAATVAIDVAENQQLLATVHAPATGVVVDAPMVGEVVAPGAAIATIRDGPTTSITTWLSPTQMAQVCLGSQASVRADWMTGQPLGAMITLIGDRADYPPTAFATDEVHLTRAVPVRLTLTRSSGQGQSLPPGSPVDIEILPAANDGSCATGTSKQVR
jgi:multidrug resistance efflux pump